MSLTFSFYNASTGGWAYRCRTNDNYRDNCIKNYAVHEFGHAIGLEHEADRTDSTCSQSTKIAVISVGNYDEDSIMNYCANQRYIQNNWVPKLSDGDIAGIKQLYSNVANEPTPPSEPNPPSVPNPPSELSGNNFVITGSGNGLTTATNRLSCPNNGDNSGIESIESFNFANSSVTVKLSLDTGFKNHSQYFGVEGPGGKLYLRLFQWGNTYQLKAGYNSGDLVHKNYSTVNDNYLKISHQAAYNRVTFWTSADGNNWKAFGNKTFTNASDMKLFYSCGSTPSNIQDVKIKGAAKGF